MAMTEISDDGASTTDIFHEGYQSGLYFVIVDEVDVIGKLAMPRDTLSSAIASIVGQAIMENRNGKIPPRVIIEEDAMNVTTNVQDSNQDQNWATRSIILVIKMMANETLQIGQLALNAEQLGSIDHRALEQEMLSGSKVQFHGITEKPFLWVVVISIDRFVAPTVGFDLAELRVEVEILDGGSIALKQIAASSIAKEFVKAFHKQILTEYQSVILRCKGNLYRASVVDVSVGGPTSVAHKHGMLRNSTKITVEVSDSLRHLITGAETYKSVLREGLNLDYLEEELMAQGIAAMTPLIRKILEKAFGSRMISRAEAKRLKLQPVRGMDLYGPTGSGKTLIALGICKLLNAKEPKRRGQGMGQQYVDRIIDGVQKLQNIFVIGTTNRLGMLDEALIREGRLELLIKVDYPDKQGRLKILELHSRNFRVDPGVDLHEIGNFGFTARRTQRCSGATVGSLATSGYTYAVRDLGLTNSGTARVNATLKMTHFLRALEDMNRNLQEKQSLRPVHSLASPLSVSIPDGQLDSVQRIRQEQEKIKEDCKELKLSLDKIVAEISLSLSLHGSKNFLIASLVLFTVLVSFDFYILYHIIRILHLA
ncbi:hypothetical protein RJ640_002772 [Escallonia rubra]|uniref:Vesicle-fusing ATPase n=1 Tax=Escallonia rubra TaxID=112253 RepID=A0AA88R3I4_9ASTE|nr:hypothetical protein RJ640_002772 [Escallonia rubra]